MKTAISFAGQGDQKIGMLKDLYDTYPLVRQTFEEAGDALCRDMAALCFTAAQEELNKTENAQSCLMTVEYAAYRLFLSLGGRADMLAGFSLGECAVAAASDAISFSNGLRLVAFRAREMQRCVPLGQGGMAAILGQSEEAVEALCKEAQNVWPSNYNCPGQTVISGEKAGIDAVCAAATTQGITCMPLAVSIPSHCPLMQPAADALKAYLADVPFASPAMPVVTGIDAAMTQDGDALKEKLARQLVTPIRYAQCLHTMRDAGAEAFIEIGPGRTLTGLVKKTLPDVQRLRISDRKTLEETLRMVNARAAL